MGLYCTCLTEWWSGPGLQAWSLSSPYNTLIIIFNKLLSIKKLRQKLWSVKNVILGWLMSLHVIIVILDFQSTWGARKQLKKNLIIFICKNLIPTLQMPRNAARGDGWCCSGNQLYCPTSGSSSSLFLFEVGASGSGLMPEVTFIMTLLFPAESWSLGVLPPVTHITTLTTVSHNVKLTLNLEYIMSSWLYLLHTCSPTRSSQEDASFHLIFTIYIVSGPSIRL